MAVMNHTIILDSSQAKIFNGVAKDRPFLSQVCLRGEHLYATDGHLLISIPCLGYKGPEIYFNKPSVMPTRKGMILITIKYTLERVLECTCNLYQNGQPDPQNPSIDLSAQMYDRFFYHESQRGDFPDVDVVFSGLDTNSKVGKGRFNMKLMKKITDVIGTDVMMQFTDEYGAVMVWNPKVQGNISPVRPSIIMPMRCV